MNTPHPDAHDVTLRSSIERDVTQHSPGNPGKRTKSGETDSGGVPWGGRTLSPQPFAGDTGEADPALVAALLAHRHRGDGEAEVVAALTTARVLVPVVATTGEGHPLPDHVRGDAGADMSLPLVASSGGTALPVFTSVRALAHWDAAARPVPVEATRAALSAVDEGCTALVLDPAGPDTFVVRRPALWALAQGRTWTPPEADGELLDAVVAALEPISGVGRVRLEPGRSAQTAVVIEVEPGLDQAALHRLTGQVGVRLGQVELLAERTESVQVRPLPGRPAPE